MMEAPQDNGLFPITCAVCGVSEAIEAQTIPEAHALFSTRHKGCMSVRAVAESNPDLAREDRNGVHCPVCDFFLDEDFLVRT